MRNSKSGSNSLLSSRWEEEKYEDGVKWKFLEHKGPYFPPDYTPLPDDVNFYYNGQYSMSFCVNVYEVFTSKQVVKQCL